MGRSISFAPEEYYHIYNRGVDKRCVFMSPQDSERFLTLLYLCNSNEPVNFHKHLDRGMPLVEMFSFNHDERLVDIGAYCLMPNHFHILVRSRDSEGISDFMQKILTAYTMYFNKKYERRGALFSGSFQARHVDSDRYLRHLFSYIHANPFGLLYPLKQNKLDVDMLRVKAHLKCFPFSSLADYVGNSNRHQAPILNKEAFPDYFSTDVDIDEHLNDFFAMKDLAPDTLGLSS